MYEGSYCVYFVFCIYILVFFFAIWIPSNHLYAGSDSETSVDALVVKVEGVGCMESGGKGTWKRTNEIGDFNKIMNLGKVAKKRPFK